MFKRFLAVLIIITFVITSNQPYAYTAQNMKPIDTDLILPVDIGKVSDSFKGSKNKIVYIILDLHCNKKVQKNIRHILGSIKKHHKLKKLFVGVEGNSGDMEGELLSSMPEGKIKDIVLEGLLDQGLITGVELYNAYDPKGIYMYGIENKEIYNEDFKYLFRSLGYIDEIEELKEKSEKMIKFGKEIFYPKQLKELEKKEQEYIKGKISSQEYAYILIELARQRKISIKEYKNLIKKTQKEELNKKLNKEIVNSSIIGITKIILPKLKQEEIEIIEVLMQKSVRDFNNYIIKLIEKYKINIEEMYPELDSYIKIRKLEKELDSIKVLSELQLLNYKVKKSIVQGKGLAEDILYCDRFFKVMEIFIKNEISMNEMEEWNKEKGKFIEKMKRINEKLWRENYFKEKEGLINEAEQNMTRFYKLAIKRNELLVQNMLSFMQIAPSLSLRGGEAKPVLGLDPGAAISTKEAGTSDEIAASATPPRNDTGFSATPPRNDSKRGNDRRFVGAMIIGGFHEQGIKEILRNKAVSYKVIIPNAIGSSVQEAKKIYIERITKQAERLGLPVSTVVPVKGVGLNLLALSQIGAIDLLSHVMYIMEHTYFELKHFSTEEMATRRKWLQFFDKNIDMIDEINLKNKEKIKARIEEIKKKLLEMKEEEDKIRFIDALNRLFGQYKEEEKQAVEDFKKLKQDLEVDPARFILKELRILLQTYRAMIPNLKRVSKLEKILRERMRIGKEGEERETVTGTYFSASKKIALYDRLSFEDSYRRMKTYVHETIHSLQREERNKLRIAWRKAIEKDRYFVSEYGISGGWAEDMAEAGALLYLDPLKLKMMCSKRYKYLTKNVFKDFEFDKNIIRRFGEKGLEFAIKRGNFTLIDYHIKEAQKKGVDNNKYFAEIYEMFSGNLGYISGSVFFQPMLWRKFIWDYFKKKDINIFENEKYKNDFVLKFFNPKISTRAKFTSLSEQNRVSKYSNPAANMQYAKLQQVLRYGARRKDYIIKKIINELEKPGMDKQVIKDFAFSKFHNREQQNIEVFFNFSKAKLTKSILDNIDFSSLNEEEFRILLGLTVQHRYKSYVDKLIKNVKPEIIEKVFDMEFRIGKKWIAKAVFRNIGQRNLSKVQISNILQSAILNGFIKNDIKVIEEIGEMVKETVPYHLLKIERQMLEEKNEPLLSGEAGEKQFYDFLFSRNDGVCTALYVINFVLALGNLEEESIFQNLKKGWKQAMKEDSYFIKDYDWVRDMEDAAVLYSTDPLKLQMMCPKRYAYLKKNIFRNHEFFKANRDKFAEKGIDYAVKNDNFTLMRHYINEMKKTQIDQNEHFKKVFELFQKNFEQIKKKRFYQPMLWNKLIWNNLDKEKVDILFTEEYINDPIALFFNPNLKHIDIYNIEADKRDARRDYLTRDQNIFFNRLRDVLKFGGENAARIMEENIKAFKGKKLRRRILKRYIMSRDINFGSKKTVFEIILEHNKVELARVLFKYMGFSRISEKDLKRVFNMAIENNFVEVLVRDDFVDMLAERIEDLQFKTVRDMFELALQTKKDKIADIIFKNFKYENLEEFQIREVADIAVKNGFLKDNDRKFKKITASNNARFIFEQRLHMQKDMEILKRNIVDKEVLEQEHDRKVINFYGKIGFKGITVYINEFTNIIKGFKDTRLLNNLKEEWINAIKDDRYFVSKNAMEQGWLKDLRDAMLLYFTDPLKLQMICEHRYNFLKRNIFRNHEFFVYVEENLSDETLERAVEKENFTVIEKNIKEQQEQGKDHNAIFEEIYKLFKKNYKKFYQPILWNEFIWRNFNKDEIKIFDDEKYKDDFALIFLKHDLSYKEIYNKMIDEDKKLKAFDNLEIDKQFWRMVNALKSGSDQAYSIIQDCIAELNRIEEGQKTLDVMVKFIFIVDQKNMKIILNSKKDNLVELIYNNFDFSKLLKNKRKIFYDLLIQSDYFKLVDKIVNNMKIEELKNLLIETTESEKNKVAQVLFKNIRYENLSKQEINDLLRLAINRGLLKYTYELMQHLDLEIISELYDQYPQIMNNMKLEMPSIQSEDAKFTISEIYKIREKTQRRIIDTLIKSLLITIVLPISIFFPAILVIGIIFSVYLLVDVIISVIKIFQEFKFFRQIPDPKMVYKRAQLQKEAEQGFELIIPVDEDTESVDQVLKNYKILDKDGNWIKERTHTKAKYTGDLNMKNLEELNKIIVNQGQVISNAHSSITLNVGKVLADRILARDWNKEEKEIIDSLKKREAINVADVLNDGTLILDMGYISVETRKEIESIVEKTDKDKTIHEVLNTLWAMLEEYMQYEEVDEYIDTFMARLTKESIQAKLEEKRINEMFEQQSVEKAAEAIFKAKEIFYGEKGIVNTKKQDRDHKIEQKTSKDFRNDLTEEVRKQLEKDKKEKEEEEKERKKRERQIEQAVKKHEYLIFKDNFKNGIIIEGLASAKQGLPMNNKDIADKAVTVDITKFPERPPSEVSMIEEIGTETEKGLTVIKDLIVDRLRNIAGVKNGKETQKDVDIEMEHLNGD